MGYISMESLSGSILSRTKLAGDKLEQNFRAISSGKKINSSADAPADFGVSNSMLFTIKNADVSSRVLENAQGALSTSDSWMQSAHDILLRMSELATAAVDGSKNSNDRQNLQLEFSQLQKEVRSIARNGQYNGIQVAGKDSIVSYDKNLQTFVFAQPDGSQATALSRKIVDGLKSSNGQDYGFEQGKDYSLSLQGDKLFYVDKDNALVRYDLEKDVIARDSSDLSQKTLDIDEKGRLWYSSTQDGISYTLKQHDINEWQQDQSLVTDTSFDDVGNSEFSVYQDYVYYVQKDTQDVVRRHLQNPTEVEVVLKASDYPYNLNNFSLSEDGEYLTDVSSSDPSQIRVINLKSKQQAAFQADPGVVASKVKITPDNNEVVFYDTTSQTVRRVTMNPGEEPSFISTETVMSPSEGEGFANFSVEGGAHSSYLRVHDGPLAGQEYFAETGDVRLFTLGIAGLSVDTLQNAQKAVGKLQDAIQTVSLQRAKTGASYSHLTTNLEALSNYKLQLNLSYGEIRDANMAEEAAKMAANKLIYETSMTLMPQLNALSRLNIDLLK